MGASNPFPVGGMTPVMTSSGQVQFQGPGGYAGGNQMDLLFNRKVVKPIKGGTQRRESMRESSKGRRPGGLASQMTFDEFMSN